MPALENFLTKKEKQRAQTRFKILEFLDRGLTIREVAKHLKVSTATVVKTRKYFKEKKEEKELAKSLPSPKISRRRWVWG